MKMYSSALIIRRYEERKLTLRKLTQLTKDIDPNNKGVSMGTIQRVLSGVECLPSNLCLICAALGISPSSTYVELNHE